MCHYDAPAFSVCELCRRAVPERGTEFTMKNNANNEAKKLPLAEMKKLVPTTKGKTRPTAKYLRENETVIAMSECGESKMAVYASGFALYANPGHQYVLRLDCINSAEYELMEDAGLRNTYVPLDEVDWDTAVFLDGEQRIEADRLHRLSQITTSMTGTGVQDDEGEPQDMEVDAGVDVVGDYVRAEEKAEAVKQLDAVLSCLTERQRMVYRLYHIDGVLQQEIADRLGITFQAVSKILITAENNIRKNISKNF